MTHEIWHIICGGAGAQLGEKEIEIYDNSVLNVAINLKRDGFAAYGISPEKAQKLGQEMQADVMKWYAKLAKWGVPVHVYTPHAENFEK